MRAGSIVSMRFFATPACVRSTSTSDTARSPEPPLLASTMAKVAASPSVTGSFLPLRRPPPNVVRMLRGFGGCAPSAIASVPIALPDASSGSHSFFCASEPASFSASVASTTDESNGTGAAARPISSATTQTSSGDSPMPPYSSGMPRAGTPRSTSPFQTSSACVSGPSSTRRTTLVGHLSARNLRTCSLSSFWSSEKSKFMMPDPSKPAPLGERLWVPTGGLCCALW